jgi:citrate lyase subunit beta/citryl-CoA lyase
MLFVPGNQPRKVAKVFDAGADVAILDLEDAVPIPDKVATRAVVAEALRRPRACRAYVRVNAAATEYCYGDLLAVVGAGLDGILLPMVERAADLVTVDWLLAQLERERGLPGGSIDLIPAVETAKGHAALRDIAAAGTRVRRLSFGAADYSADLGLTPTLAEEELNGIRAETVLASRLGGLEPPIDTVFVAYREADAFAACCARGRRLGFQGKMLIHPAQVAPANAAFTPSEAEVDFATRVVAAFAQAEAAGNASFQLDGRFIDYAIVLQAKRTLATMATISRATSHEMPGSSPGMTASS